MILERLSGWYLTKKAENLKDFRRRRESHAKLQGFLAGAENLGGSFCGAENFEDFLGAENLKGFSAVQRITRETSGTFWGAENLKDFLARQRITREISGIFGGAENIKASWRCRVFQGLFGCR